jgi:hypothetical protein
MKLSIRMKTETVLDRQARHQPLRQPETQIEISKTINSNYHVPTERKQATVDIQHASKMMSAAIVETEIIVDDEIEASLKRGLLIGIFVHR